MVRAGRLAPTAPETRLAEGYFAYACDLNWNEAMRHYQAALADMPNDAELPLQIGATFRRLGRFPEAVPMLRRAVELNPLDSGYAQTLTEALLMLRRHAEAVAVGVHYGAESPEFTGVRRAVAFARFEVSGDRAALVRDLRALPPAGRDPLGVMPKYESALFGGDLAEAARVLKEPRLTTVQGINAVVAEPVSILRAYVACLLGRADEARAHAREALDFMRAGKWTYRQRTMVALAIVRATAYGGDHSEARRLADELRSELRGEDGYDEPHVLHELGRIYVLLGQPEPALACLRAITTGVSPTDGGPRLLQIDPVWSRLADDPRFREILRQVKPL
jgi:tetratricopeptide (TPR) repeat protein